MKKHLICIIAAVLFAAVSLPDRAAGAEVFNIDGTGTVTITSGQAAGDGASTFQFSLNVDSPNAVRVEFRFRENGAKVQEFRYDPDGKLLSVYVAGTKVLFAADTASLTVGQVVALDGGGNAVAASVSVKENSFQYVCGTELRQGTGMQLPGTVQIRAQDADPKPPQEDDNDFQGGDSEEEPSQGDDWAEEPPQGDDLEEEPPQGDDPEEEPPQEDDPEEEPSQGGAVTPPVPELPQGGAVIPPAPNPSQGSAVTPAPASNPSQGGAVTPAPASNPSQGSAVTPAPAPNPSQGGAVIPPASNPSQGGAVTPAPAPNPPQGSSGGTQGSVGNVNDGSADESHGKPTQTGNNTSSSVQTSGRIEDDAQDTVKSKAGTDGIFMTVLVVVLVIVTVLIIVYAVVTVAAFEKKRRR